MRTYNIRHGEAADWIGVVGGQLYEGSGGIGLLLGCISAFETAIKTVYLGSTKALPLTEYLVKLNSGLQSIAVLGKVEDEYISINDSL